MVLGPGAFTDAGAAASMPAHPGVLRFLAAVKGLPGTRHGDSLDIKPRSLCISLGWRERHEAVARG